MSGHTVYVNVEAVPPSQGSAMSLFGIAISVLPDQKIDSAAKPWTWSNISWVVWGSKDGGASWDTLKAQDIHPVPLPDGPAGTDVSGRWDQTIAVTKSRLLDAATKIIPKFVGNPPDPTNGITITNDKAYTPGEHIYLSVLADAAAGPYPIPQNLNLSFWRFRPSTRCSWRLPVSPMIAAESTIRVRNHHLELARRHGQAEISPD